MSRLRRPRLSLIAAVAAAVVLSGCVLSQTGDARIVADRSATLTGTLRSTEVDDTQHWFEYGTTTSYSATTPRTNLFVGPGVPQPVSVTVDGLTAGTTYHYRLCSDVVADTIPPICGADRVVSTSTGHVSVYGDGGFSEPCLLSYTCGESISINAAADPVHGTVEGDASFFGTGATPSGPYGYGGSATSIACLRVAGNLAVIGYEVYDSFSGSTLPVGVIIEDNGPSGDLYADVSWSPASACPAPTSALLNSGTAHSGNFVVHG